MIDFYLFFCCLKDLLSVFFMYLLFLVKILFSKFNVVIVLLCVLRCGKEKLFYIEIGFNG